MKNQGTICTENDTILK